MQKIKVLYITHETTSILGSTHSLVNMLRSVQGIVEPVVVFPAYGSAYDYVKGLGYSCVVVPFKLNILPLKYNYIKYIPRLIIDTWFNYQAKRKLATIVAEQGIDLIHSNTGVLTIGHELAKKTSRKHVWHLREFQDLDFNFRPFLGWKHLKKRILLSDATISITNAIETHFEMRDNSNSYVINDAVRSKKDIENKSQKKNAILFCGMITEAKGAEEALRIFARFTLKYPSFELWLVGKVTQNYESYLKSISNELEVSNKVQFFYYQQDVRQYMLDATALLMCSQNEAQGRVTVEAMFYGCPVVGRNSGGTKEIIKDSINGFLFDDIDEAAVKLEELIVNSEIYKKIVLNAHKTAVNSFSEEVYAEKLKSIYCRILNKQ